MIATILFWICFYLLILIILTLIGMVYVIISEIFHKDIFNQGASPTVTFEFC